MVAHQATEQIIVVHYMIHVTGNSIDGASWLFSDNQSVNFSSTIPQPMLNKCHNAVFYHLSCECNSAEIISFMHVDIKSNPSDMPTKFLGWSQFWSFIQSFLFSKVKKRGMFLRLLQ
jgi:hypothetical protein